MNNYYQLLKAKIENNQETIGIIGLGYVGLPLALQFTLSGLKVIGFDIDQSKIDNLESGNSYLNTITNDQVIKLNEGQFTATVSFEQISDVDLIILCLPTPLNRHMEPDLSFITKTMQAIKPYLRKGQLLALESTTYPGTTVEVLQPLLEKSGYTVGSDYFLAYSPEREDPGNKNHSTRTIPKLCSGVTAHCLELATASYNKAIDTIIPVSSTQIAEFAKILENIHRAVNIGLVNEMKIIADKMGLDIHEIINAAATKPFGFTAYYPGPGLGGHCIPIDPFYLTWKAKEYGLHTKFIELAGEINTKMPTWVVTKVADALNTYKKSINGSKILILGVAYKPNVSDSRESPSLELIKLLTEKGADVDYSDPYIPNMPRTRKYNFDKQSVVISASALESYDCIIIATNHDDFDYHLIADYGKLIIDTRNSMLRTAKHIIKA